MRAAPRYIAAALPRRGGPPAEFRIEPLDWREPLAAFAPLAGRTGAVLLDSALAGDPRARWSILAAFPQATLRLEGGALRIDGTPTDLPLDAALRSLLGPLAEAPALPEGAPADLPLPGLLGFLGYEAGAAFERMPAGAPADLGLPDALAGRYDAIAAFDLGGRRAWLIGRGPEAAAAARRLRTALAAAPPAAAEPRGRWQPDEHARAYPAMVRAAVEYIRAGDIFQANMTWRFLGALAPDADAFALYRRLRTLSPAPFAAFLRLAPDQAIVSMSPERFLRLGRDGLVETRPIKGTIRRAADPAEDARLAAALAASAKDRAENLMIVDLMRNDLGRSCAIGSVRVPVLFGLESYPRIHHLVSVVQGRLRAGLDAFDLLRGAFPGGSVTGAPKVRTMAVIRELEPVRRGPYCGSLFHAQADGRFDSSILIRSMAVSGGRVAAHAGGGIVADSDPAAELAEMRLKAEAMLAALR